MLDVHCTGYFLVAREAVRTFIKQKSNGVMVFVVSDNSMRPSKNFVAYNTAKAGAFIWRAVLPKNAGIMAFASTASCRAQCWRSNFWNPQLRNERAKTMWGFDPDNLEEEYKKNTALNVVIEPDEVADLILFLASSKASKMTGSVVSIDGGGKGGYVR